MGTIVVAFSSCLGEVLNPQLSTIDRPLYGGGGVCVCVVGVRTERFLGYLTKTTKFRTKNFPVVPIHSLQTNHPSDVKKFTSSVTITVRVPSPTRRLPWGRPSEIHPSFRTWYPSVEAGSEPPFLPRPSQPYYGMGTFVWFFLLSP